MNKELFELNIALRIIALFKWSVDALVSSVIIVVHQSLGAGAGRCGHKGLDLSLTSSRNGFGINCEFCGGFQEYSYKQTGYIDSPISLF